MPNEYFVTYHPLGRDRKGKKIASTHGLPPYIDHSCRREPDLQSSFPSMSCLCRKGKFVPRLALGDRILYVVRENQSYRFVAFLEVVRCFLPHDDAKIWYHQQALPLPSNCMVPGNPPQQYSLTNPTAPAIRLAGRNNPAVAIRLWDRDYASRAQANPEFVASKTLKMDLFNSPLFEAEEIARSLNRTGVPGSQNPGAFSNGEISAMVHSLWP